MAETRSLPTIEEEISEEFYEKIEAPKFVDFTTPDTRLPDDDRHWFCLRVGCDQKHEEELDPEAIYKNFVLRVMAARSPNVRLRKALNGREASESLKCPLTAPAKSSKSRVSRLALISSLSQKKVDYNLNVKPVSKVSATPNAKVKQSSVMAKALTTPRNQKKVLNIEQFISVQSKKAMPMTVVVPKNRVVAKALVFHSPKKTVKTKSSIEMKTPEKALCSAMKKLELNGVKKNEEGWIKSMPVAASRKQFKGREVKSRVFDSMYSNGRKGQETNSTRCLKEKKVKELQKRKVTVPHEEAENDSSGSLERCHESGTSEGGSELPLGAEKSRELTTRESSLQVLSDTSRGDIIWISKEENKNTEGCDNEEKRKPVLEKWKIPEAIKRKDKENSMASDNKENEVELTENDGKENVLAPDENRELITNNDDPKKAILCNKHEYSRKTLKKSTSTANGSQVVKYRKLKPTNPKPFKLRTDERGILKEANMEKKLPSPLKETTAKGSKEVRKHQNRNLKSYTCPGQSKQDTDNYNSSEEKSAQATQEDQSGSIRSTSIDNSNNKVQRKLSATTPLRNPGPKLQKPIDFAERLEHRDKASQQLDDNFKRKSQMMQPKFVRPRGVLSRKKEKVLLATPGKVSVNFEKPSTKIVQPKQAAKPRINDASPISKATSVTSRPCSRVRRAATVPKEPKFQCLHVPKSCTRKLT